MCGGTAVCRCGSYVHRETHAKARWMWYMSMWAEHKGTTKAICVGPLHDAFVLSAETDQKNLCRKKLQTPATELLEQAVRRIPFFNRPEKMYPRKHPADILTTQQLHFSASLQIYFEKGGRCLGYMKRCCSSTGCRWSSRWWESDARSQFTNNMTSLWDRAASSINLKISETWRRSKCRTGEREKGRDDWAAKVEILCFGCGVHSIALVPLPPWERQCEGLEGAMWTKKSLAIFPGEAIESRGRPS